MMTCSLACIGHNVRLSIAAMLLATSALAAEQTPQYRSHPPQRPLPQPSQHELTEGPKHFVDSARGSDEAPGTQQAPWKTLAFALRQLEPGETLYLRGGVYYEQPSLGKSGTADAPITIRSFPGELAIIDGGEREFVESPATSWAPLEGGAPGEYVSTKTYFRANDRRVPAQFLPGAWEPMWGLEDERPLALGNFADSMVPLHGYRIAADLRSTNELWLGGKNEMRDIGLYCGPGLWFNRQTGRIHIRLAHHRLAGMGEHAYQGETDPRKLPLVIAVGFGEDLFRASGVKHVRLRDLVLRGATGSPALHIYGSEDLELDGLTIYGGFPALAINASKRIRVVHSAFRGLAAPWSSRASMKYRGTASYQVVLYNNQPVNEAIEMAWCEFTDDHDFAFLRHVMDLDFHHNLVDNFNDDGLECGPKLRDHTIRIWQNRIGACLIPLTQHEIAKDESPRDHDPGSGAAVFRNVIDLRAGTFKAPPKEPDPSGSYLHGEGHLVGDHGGPIWPVIRFYHNTVLRRTPVFRNGYLFGLASQGMRDTERDVLNNIFVQSDGMPGVGFVAVTQAYPLREGGNLIWGLQEGPVLERDLFAKFRASALFDQSRSHDAGGWTTDDRAADPKFARLVDGAGAAADLRLQPGSPAIDLGRAIPADWPDPLRQSDEGRPDAGAIPANSKPWGVGIHSRIPLFGE